MRGRFCNVASGLLFAMLAGSALGGCVVEENEDVARASQPYSDVSTLAGAPGDPAELIQPLRAATEKLIADASGIQANAELLAQDGTFGEGLAAARALSGAMIEMRPIVDDLERVMRDRVAQDRVRKSAPIASGVSPKAGPVGPGIMVYLALLQEKQRTGELEADRLRRQVEADRQRRQMERFKILQDTQTKIFEMTQDITLHKQKTNDKAWQAWDRYLRGEK